MTVHVHEAVLLRNMWILRATLVDEIRADTRFPRELRVGRGLQWGRLVIYLRVAAVDDMTLPTAASSPLSRLGSSHFYGDSTIQMVLYEP